MKPEHGIAALDEQRLNVENDRVNTSARLARSGALSGNACTVQDTATSPERGTLCVDEIAAYLDVSFTVARRVAARMPGPMTARQFEHWVTAFPNGADILVHPVPPMPPPEADMPPQSVKGVIRGLVYFAEAHGAERIKIGFTKHQSAKKRVSDLQTGCPFPVLLLGWFRGSMATEVFLHGKYASSRVMPNAEWFYATPDLRAFISRISVMP